MQEPLYDHHTSTSIGGRLICNLRFADDTDLLGSNKGEFQDITNRLRATAYGMKVITEKSKLVTNSTNNISADISINGQKLEEVTCAMMAPV